jgi:hypothetical protein
LSRITVGSLADLGYTVNYAAADSYSKPAGLSATSRPFGGGSAALRSGFVNLTVPDGLLANPVAFNSLRTAAYADLRPSAVLALESMPISASTADSAVEQMGATTRSSTLYSSIHSHDHDTNELDPLWLEIAEGWNPMLRLAIA